MKFKCRDTVRCAEWHNYVGKIVRIDGHPYYPYILDNDTRWGEKDLVLVKPAEEPKDTTTMRQFESGATRNNDPDRLDYDGFLSPLVLRRFAQYMHKHRKQADGTLRASDNWQKGIPKDEYRKSIWRHFIDLWYIQRGWEERTEEGLDGVELLCALMFNVQGLLHETIKETLAEEDNVAG